MPEQQEKIKTQSFTFRAYENNITGNFEVTTQLGLVALNAFFTDIINSGGTFEGLGIMPTSLTGRSVNCMMIFVAVPQDSPACQYITGPPVENKIAKDA